MWVKIDVGEYRCDCALRSIFENFALEWYFGVWTHCWARLHQNFRLKNSGF